MNKKTSFGTLFLLLAGSLASRALGQHNALTQAEKDAHYQLLFNGRDFTGWRAPTAITPPTNRWNIVPESTWQVLNIYSLDPDRGSLITASTYMNFDFKVEWATSPGANSCIFIRYLTNPPNGGQDAWGGAFGPEAQVGDRLANSDEKTDLHRPGDCYDMFEMYPQTEGWDYPGLKDASGNAIYRYNQFRIIAYGPHVAHYGNGRKLVEYVI